MKKAQVVALSLTLGVSGLIANVGHASTQKQSPKAVAPAETSPTRPSETTKKSEPLDITSPRGRVLRGTAHTLDTHTVGLRAHMLGTRTDELWGALGVDYGWGHGVQTGINLLHASAGMLNLYAKWSFLRHRTWALSAEFSPFWVHGNWVWLKRDSEIVGNIDVIGLPLGVSATWLPFSFIQFDLEALYSHIEAFGNLSSESLAFDTDILLRTFRLVPSIRFHLQRRVSLAFSARVPLYASIPGALTAEVELQPGVEAGVRTAGNINIPLKDLYELSLMVRAMASRRVFLEFGLNYGPVTRALYRNWLSPKVGLEVRF